METQPRTRKRQKAPRGYQVVSIEGQNGRFWLALAAQFAPDGALYDVIVARESAINGEIGTPITANSRQKALEYIKIAQLNTEIAQLRAENQQLRGQSLAAAS